MLSSQNSLLVRVPLLFVYVSFYSPNDVNLSVHILWTQSDMYFVGSLDIPLIRMTDFSRFIMTCE